jgi:Tfp pilus assembly protein PilF
MLIEAEKSFLAGDFTRAIAYCDNILESSPKNIKAIRLRAFCYQNENNIMLAKQEFKKLLKHEPKNSDLLNILGNLSLVESDYNSAKKYFIKSIEISPDFSLAYNNLAICHQYLGDFPLAQRNYEKAISLNSNPADFYQNLGTLHMELGEFALAEQYLFTSLEKDPKQSQLYIHVFNLFMYQHRYKDALEVADLAIVSGNLSDMLLCELLIGKAILFWLFDNTEEACQAIKLSESINADTASYPNLRNLRIFHRYLTLLIDFKHNNIDLYKVDTCKKIYFISESHGLSPAGTHVEHNNEHYKIQSLFVQGAKVFHIGKQTNNKYKESLIKLLKELPLNSKVILGFGEIDCRSNEGVIHYCLKTGKDYKTVIDNIIDNYIDIIKLESKAYNHEVFFYGVPAPHSGIVNQLANEKERVLFISIIQYFNERMKLKCQKNQLAFLDAYSITNNKGVSNMKYNIDLTHMKPHFVAGLFNL